VTTIYPRRRFLKLACATAAVSGATGCAKFVNVDQVLDSENNSSHELSATFYQADNIQYLLSGKIRNLPVRHNLMERLSEIVADLDGGLKIAVTSAGQPALGTTGKRTGSTRHDIDENGYGGAVDLHLRLHGEKILPGDAFALYEQLIETAAQYFPGIGHYQWGIHVGFGSPAFWGPNGTSGSAAKRFRLAYERGRLQ